MEKLKEKLAKERASMLRRRLTAKPPKQADNAGGVNPALMEALKALAQPTRKSKAGKAKAKEEGKSKTGKAKAKEEETKDDEDDGEDEDSVSDPEA